jgi:glutamate/tyrosine decarboxylase-like PLP-dependent enzyme
MSKVRTDYVPECSRRARAVPVYAAIRSLGRAGVAELIERNCAQARRMAERLAAIPGATVLNDVVLSQVLLPLPGGDDANRAAVTAVQRDGTCWVWGHYLARPVRTAGTGLQLGDHKRRRGPLC